MDAYSDIAARIAERHLTIMGGFHPEPDDGVPEGCATLLLLGPREPGFWAAVSITESFTDDAPDPLDRWSRQVIGRLACDLGAKAYFPFGGPPWHPFIGWAQKTGRIWTSPVGLLIHDEAGLMVSFRGALGLRERIDLPQPPATRPCESCSAQPCRPACPVDALSETAYDTGACHGFLDTASGRDCLTRGCAVRRACPISRTYGRRPEQSAFHMRSFHP